LKKDYKFTRSLGGYEFCPENKDGCLIMEQLQDGDKAHTVCAPCIEKYEKIEPSLSKLYSTTKLRKARRKKLENN